MKKSENITKYDLNWQLLRVGVKGKHNDNLQKKFELTNEYLSEFYYDRWERVYNWAEGLLRGFKASFDFEKQIEVASYLDNLSQIKYKYIKQEPVYSYDLQKYSLSELIYLWKDLFKTNKNWLVKGYFHKECNAFMDFLFSGFVNVDLGIYSKKNLDQLRVESSFITNKHKFFF